jgi:predicted negative regulator of RcsB-dependent stress response
MADTKNNQKAVDYQTAVNQKEDFILKYKTPIIGCIVALLLCVGGYFLWKSFSTGKQEQASTEMAKAQEYFLTAMNSGDSLLFEKALNGDSINAGFLAIADDYSSTKAGNLATLYAGICYASLGKMDEAAKYLGDFDTADDALISPAALGRLGNAKAALGDLDGAVELLVKAAKRADNNSLSPLFLIQAGEILESQGKKAEALKLYEQVKSDYAEFQQYNQYMQGFNGIDNYIERVKE